MENIQIRPANLNDLPMLLEFQQGVVDWERPYDPTIANDPVFYYDIKNLILDKEAIALVATVDGRPIACGIGMEKDARHYLRHKTYAYLGLMFTHPDYRGQGINAKIIEALKTWAEKKGLKEIRLTVYEENHLAIKAYEKMGFKKHISEMRLV